MPRIKSRRARVLRDRLSQAEFREACQVTPEQMAALDLICAGRPPRNAMAILKGLEIRASYAYQKPASKLEHDVTESLATALIAARQGAR